MPLRLLLLLLLLAGFWAAAGCSPVRWEEGRMPPGERAEAEAFVHGLASGSDQGFETLGDAGAADQSRISATRAAELLDDAPGRLRPLLYTREQGGAGQSVHRYELSSAGRFYMVEMVFAGPETNRRIVGWSLTPLERSALEARRFGLAGRSALHYLMLFLAVAVPALVVWSLYRIAIAPELERRWLWFAAAAFGLGKISIDWATGILSFKPVAVLLFGASLAAPAEGGGWDIGFGLPLAALVFLARHRRAKPQVAR